MGLFGNHKNDPAFGDRVRAAFAMLNGDQNAPFRFQQLQLERQRLGMTQAQQQREQQAQDDQIWAAKQNGFSPAQISQLNPNDLSQLGRERFTPRQYGPEGGSTGYTNADGTTRYEVAPYQRQVGRTVIGAGPNNTNQSVIFRGVEPVSIPNVGVRGYTDQGLADGANPPQIGFIPQGGAQAMPEAPQSGMAPPPQMQPQAYTPQPTAPAFGAGAPLSVEDRRSQYPSDNPNTPQREASRAPDPLAIPSGNPLDPNLRRY